MVDARMQYALQEDAHKVACGSRGVKRIRVLVHHLVFGQSPSRTSKIQSEPLFVRHESS